MNKMVTLLSRPQKRGACQQMGKACLYFVFPLQYTNERADWKQKRYLI